MKALVTGASGFIGSHLVEALTRKGYEVTCLARKSANLRWIEHLDIKYIYGDLSDPGSYADRIAGFDYIFHLAGLTKAVREKEFFTANTENTKKLLQVAAEQNHNVRRFIFLSSLAAIGPSSNGRPVREDSPPAPVSAYGKSKLDAESAVLDYSRRMPVTILRPPAVYGPRDRDFFLLFRAIKKGFFPYWGQCYYSLIYVEDLIRGIIVSAESQKAENKTYFLADNMLYTNDDIVREISLALNTRAVRLRLPLALMPVLAVIAQKIDKKGIINADRVRDFKFNNWTCDPGKAEEELGFSPGITLEEGIKWTADWYRTQRWL